MFPIEVQVQCHQDASGEGPDTQPEVAILRLQDAPYDDTWAAYYAETEESQKARGGKKMYELFIPHPTWPELHPSATPLAVTKKLT